MQPYYSPNETGVKSYKNGDDYIIVKFKDGLYYKYTYDSAGKETIEMLKKLAVSGRGGLNRALHPSRHISHKSKGKSLEEL